MEMEDLPKKKFFVKLSWKYQNRYMDRFFPYDKIDRDFLTPNMDFWDDNDVISAPKSVQKIFLVKNFKI